MTPSLTFSEIREFLELNRSFSAIAFMPLAQSVLNGFSISLVFHRTAIPYLAEMELIEMDSDNSEKMGIYKYTLKGEKYVKFLLGGRYVLPPKSFLPEGEISEQLVYACANLADHLERAGRYDRLRSIPRYRTSQPETPSGPDETL